MVTFTEEILNRKLHFFCSVCKCCGETAEGSKCDSRKMCEFSNDKEDDIVTIKQCDTHSCSPFKPKTRENTFKGDIFKQAYVVKRDLLSIMIKEGADFNQIEAKAAQLLNRPLLNKIKNDNKNPELIKLVELKGKYRKNDKYLVYPTKDRRIKNSPTYVFKTSQTSLKIASKIDVSSGHFMKNQFVNLDGSEKRVLTMN